MTPKNRISTENVDKKDIKILLHSGLFFNVVCLQKTSPVFYASSIGAEDLSLQAIKLELWIYASKSQKSEWYSVVAPIKGIVKGFFFHGQLVYYYSFIASSSDQQQQLSLQVHLPMKIHFKVSVFKTSLSH